MSAGSSVERKAILFLAVLMAAACLFLVGKRVSGLGKSPAGDVSVTIRGRVVKPGTYRVPAGTTRFQILKVAGVYQNSDINGIDVYAQVADGEKMEVGKLQKDVAVRTPAEPAADCRVNFFIGKVRIAGREGERKPERNQGLREGDRIESGPDGVIEISFRDGSFVDLKRNGTLVLEKLYAADPAGGTAVLLRVPSGRLWAFVGPQPQNTRFTFASPHLSAVIKGTELELAVDAGQSRVNLIKGLVTLSSPDLSRSVTLAAGQRGVAYADPDKGMETGSMTDAVTDAEMAAFQAEKARALSEQEAHRILYLGLPDYYMLCEIDPAGPRIAISRIDPRMHVGDYISGVNELGKVYLYGGIGLVQSLIERIAGKRIEKYFLQDRNGVMQIIDDLGGITLTLDERSAKYLGAQKGPARLDGLRAVKYMSPTRDSRANAMDRQNQVMAAILKAMTDQSLTYSAFLGGKVLAKASTDMDLEYLNALSEVFGKGTGWNVEFTSLAVR